MAYEGSGGVRNIPASDILTYAFGPMVEQVVPRLSSILYWIPPTTRFPFGDFAQPTPFLCHIRGESSVTRISRDEMLMGIALVVKQRSTCLRRQVGAVVALDGRIISTGYNGAPSHVPHCTPAKCNETTPCLDTIHAEANAIAFAARNGISTNGASLFTTATPCRECAKLIINAGIIEVVYDELYRDVSPIALLESVGIRVRICTRGSYQPGWQDPRAQP